MSGIIGNDIIGNFQPATIDSGDIILYNTINFKSQATTNLTTSINSTITNFSVYSLDVFPTTPFYIAVDNEIMLVYEINDIYLMVLRGQEGTTAISHAQGASVSNVISKAGLNSRIAEMYMMGTEDELPSAGIAGRIFQPTKTPYYRFIDNGSKWQINFNNLTFNQSNIDLSVLPNSNYAYNYATFRKLGIASFIMPSAGSTYTYLYMPIPTPPYTMDTVVSLQTHSGGVNSIGHGVKATDGHLSISGITLGTNQLLFVDNMTNDSSGSTFFSINQIQSYAYLRLIDDGTNFTYKYSFDGVTYNILTTQSRTWHSSTNAYLIWTGRSYFANFGSTAQFLSVNVS